MGGGWKFCGTFFTFVRLFQGVSRHNVAVSVGFTLQHNL